MRILALSDTHIPAMAEDIPKAVYEEAAKCDLILHAGDFTELSLYEKLKKITKLTAVYGNMDSRELTPMLKPKEIIEVKGFRIGLIHGRGAPNGLIERIADEFKEEKVDCIVFGHSHCAVNKTFKNILFLNPGSPTDRVFAPYNSVGIIEVSDGLKAEIIKL